MQAYNRAVASMINNKPAVNAFVANEKLNGNTLPADPKQWPANVIARFMDF